jgi:hypothetical protein
MEAKRPNNLKVFGLKATAIYLIALFGALPAFAHMGWMTLAPFHFNELGDFLAGAFGPLAIFWLVLGFLQQGEELQHSVRALQLQAEELKHSVDAQRELVAIGNAEADARRRRLDPLFSFSTPDGVLRLNGAAWEKTKLVLRNEGNEINSVEVCYADRPSTKLANVLILKNSASTTIDDRTHLFQIRTH